MTFMFRVDTEQPGTSAFTETEMEILNKLRGAEDSWGQCSLGQYLQKVAELGGYLA